MRKTMLIFAAAAGLALAAAASAAPALAGSTWEGEFFNAGPNGAFSGTYGAKFAKGKISGDLTSVFMGAPFEPAGLRFTGTYKNKGNGRLIGNIPLAGGKFTAHRGHGKMVGSFKAGGGFNGIRTGKTSKGSSGSKRGK